MPVSLLAGCMQMSLQVHDTYVISNENRHPAIHIYIYTIIHTHITYQILNSILQYLEQAWNHIHK